MSPISTKIKYPRIERANVIFNAKLMKSDQDVNGPSNTGCWSIWKAVLDGSMDLTGVRRNIGIYAPLKTALSTSLPN